MNQTSKSLILAEKPSVAREIAKVLGLRGRGQGYLEDNRYVITWAVGHLVNIAEPGDQNPDWGKQWSLQQLPMIPERFTLTVLDQTRDQFAIVKSLMARDDITDIINATDAGREGELIFRRIYLTAGCTKPIKRLWANDMTEAGLKKALANLVPGEDKRNLGLAAFARAEADWLVGMNFSRLFTVKTGGLVTVGRVQSPVLKLLVDRRKAIENFKPQNYWTIEGMFGQEDEPFKGVWFAPPKRKDNKLWEEDHAKELAKQCTDKQGMVESVSSTRGRQRPPLPFDLTTLQREANTRFGLSAKRVLEIAQELYESKKILTYPRTDSRYLTTEVYNEILDHLRAIYPHFQEISTLAAERIKAATKKFACVNDKKVSDHHAIIPTKKPAVREQLSPDQWNIYEMVCRRTMAAFLPDCTFLTSQVWILVETEPFKATGKIFKDRGWFVAEPWRTAKDNPLPGVAKGDPIKVREVGPVKHTTKPPAHFTDASLLGAMETAGKLVDNEELQEALKERGLGTPATRAQIIETLISRNYVTKQGKKLMATDKGCHVVETVEASLPDLVSPELTGSWEQELKTMEHGNITYPQFMGRIKNMVRQGVENLRNRKFATTPATLPPGKTSLGKCPKCGGDVVENSKAYGCINWREANGGCRFTIWKNMFGGKINKTQVKELLTKEITSNALKLETRDGKKYEARLILQQGRVKVDMQTNNRSATAKVRQQVAAQADEPGDAKPSP
ncbi:type IA DNA topoisomerase [Desulfoplanes formicivorans]|uniref:DNA topoisomerase n=1 Tax=Desulfoplanes formicivorans TaxID=1592317 RepID=A0A194ACT2_9BACT|nr:type IA DNA topoisomerase [Desulfoplanes formicivorans]GAU07917.1 DNA topoisomerase III [Desulfoplanes formicivorans]